MSRTTRNFFREIYTYCFSPSSKMAPIPHYIYDILNENPLKLLNLIEYEFRLGKLMSGFLSAFLWFFLFGKITVFFACNWLISFWLVSVCLLNFVILLPRFLIFEQINRVCKFVNEFQRTEENEVQDMVRNLLWNQIFQTKIYVFTQTIMKNLSFSYFSGIMLIVIDSGEHGLFKACTNDGGLKKICLVIIAICFLKLFLIKKKLNDPNNFDIVQQRRRITKEQCALTKKEEKVCSICLLDFEYNQEVNLMRCKHFFHRICIENWLRIKRKCPMCNH